MVKSIFLDLDDTILDFQKAEKRAISETLRSFGIEPTAAVVERYHQLNRQQWELLEEGKLTRPQVLTRRFDLLFGELGVDRSSHEAQAVYEVQLSQGHFFMPGARELLETRAGETPDEANGWGILDHGVGSLEKVHVVNGRTVDVDMGQETAYVYMAGKRYRLRGDMLTEED